MGRRLPIRAICDYAFYGIYDLLRRLEWLGLLEQATVCITGCDEEIAGRGWSDSNVKKPFLHKASGGTHWIFQTLVLGGGTAAIHGSVLLYFNRQRLRHKQL